jgi:hypothetical protein
LRSASIISGFYLSSFTSTLKFAGRFFFLPNQAGSVLPVRRKRRKTYFFCHKSFAVIPPPWEKLSMHTK